MAAIIIASNNARKKKDADALVALQEASTAQGTEYIGSEGRTKSFSGQHSDTAFDEFFDADSQPSTPSRSSQDAKTPPESKSGGGSEREIDSEEKTGLAGMSDEEKVLIKTSIQEMLMYLIFLILFTLVAIIPRSSVDSFYFGAAVKDALAAQEFPDSFTFFYKSLPDAGAVEDIYIYLEGVLYQIMYSGETFDGDGDFRVNPRRMMFGTTELVGAVRVGQNRVEPGPCDIPNNIIIDDPDLQCYPKWDGNPAGGHAKESEEPFGLDPGDPWVFNREQATGDEPLFTSRNTKIRYPTPGHSVLLPRHEGAGCGLDVAAEEEEGEGIPPECPAASAIAKLRENAWVDRATRSVFVDMNLYNVQIDMIIVVRIVFEMLPSGGVINEYHFETFRPYPYESTGDFVLLAFQLLLVCFALWYFAFEVKVLMLKKWRYFADLSKYPQFLCLALILVVFIMEVIVHAAIMPKRLDTQEDVFYSQLRAVAELKSTAASLIGFALFCAWGQIFKYLSFMPQFAQITHTLALASGQLGGFALCLFIVVFGSQLSFIVAFGLKVAGFRNLEESFFSLMMAMLLSFDFEDLRTANFWSGPIFLVVFVVMSGFILLNMFIAIVVDAYTMCRDELAEAATAGKPSYGRIICMYVLYEWVYGLPILGPYVKRAVDKSKEVAQMSSRLSSGMKGKAAVGMKSFKNLGTKALSPRSSSSKSGI